MAGARAAAPRRRPARRPKHAPKGAGFRVLPAWRHRPRRVPCTVRNGCRCAVLQAASRPCEQPRRTTASNWRATVRSGLRRSFPATSTAASAPGSRRPLGEGMHLPGIHSAHGSQSPALIQDEDTHQRWMPDDVQPILPLRSPSPEPRAVRSSPADRDAGAALQREIGQALEALEPAAGQNTLRAFGSRPSEPPAKARPSPARIALPLGRDLGYDARGTHRASFRPERARLTGADTQPGRALLCPSRPGAPAPATPPGDAQGRGDEVGGAGVRGRGEDLCGRPLLHEPARRRHRHPVGAGANHRKVVADEKAGRAEAPTQPGQQIEGLRPHRPRHRPCDHRRLRTLRRQALLRISGVDLFARPRHLRCGALAGPSSALLSRVAGQERRASFRPGSGGHGGPPGGRMAADEGATVARHGSPRDRPVGHAVGAQRHEPGVVRPRGPRR